jgi:hypothetical protein
MSDSAATPREFFVSGGTMKPNAPSYVERTADRELLDAARAGEFCYVLTCRQMGKSSLMVRTAEKLRQEETLTAIVDLSQIGERRESVSAESWYWAIARSIAKDLDLARGDGMSELKTWWKDRNDVPHTQRFSEFLEEFVLGRTTSHVVDESALVDGLVQELLVSPTAQRDETHFKYIQARMAKDRYKARSLREYRRLLKGRPVTDSPQSLSQTSLKLAGLVRRTDDAALRIANPVYQEVFDRYWVRTLMPVNWSRRIAVSVTAMLLLSMAGWYWWLLPQTYLATIRTAENDVPLEAHRKLRGILGYAQIADNELAKFWERHALRSEASAPRDEVILYRLAALNASPSDERRRMPNLWIDADYSTLRQTFRHASAVRCVAFSLDGATVLTGSGDKTARLWDAQTGAPRGEPLKHEGAVNAVAFSPDGATVLTGSYDNTARLWDAKTGKPRGEPLKHEFAVEAVAFSPDGATVLTGSGSVFSRGEARLWDAQTGAPRGEPMTHEDVVTAVAFSPDGSGGFSATRNRIHKFAFDDDTGMRHVASRPLWGMRSGGYHWTGTSPDRLKVGVRWTPYRLLIQEIRFHQIEAEPIEGDPAELLDEWQRRSALKFESGTSPRLVPRWPVSSTLPLHSGNGGGNTAP